VGGPRARLLIHIIRMPAIRKLAAEAADNGLTGARVSGWHRTCEERENPRHPRRQLAVAAAGAGLVECARRLDRKRASRSSHHCRSSRLRTTTIRDSGTHIRARPATRRPLVHRHGDAEH
jgi:hypothetical protein